MVCSCHYVYRYRIGHIMFRYAPDSTVQKSLAHLKQFRPANMLAKMMKLKVSPDKNELSRAVNRWKLNQNNIWRDYSLYLQHCPYSFIRLLAFCLIQKEWKTCLHSSADWLSVPPTADIHDNVDFRALSRQYYLHQLFLMKCKHLFIKLVFKLAFGVLNIHFIFS